MSGSATNYLENAILRHVLRAGAYPMPTGLWLGACTAHPSDAPGTEVAASGYARTVAGTFTVTAGEPSEGVNDGQLEFAVAVAAWGTITHVALYDALTGGNELMYFVLVDPADGVTPLPRDIGSGDVLRIGPGALRARCD